LLVAAFAIAAAIGHGVMVGGVDAAITGWFSPPTGNWHERMLARRLQVQSQRRLEDDEVFW
jgi:hypothetical protein